MRGTGYLFELGSLVKFHRRKARLSQIDLARTAGVSRKVVQEIEAGSETTGWKNVLAILAALNVALEPSGPLVAVWRRGVRNDHGE